MKKIIINSEQWQTRVAITENGELKNIYYESHIKESLERVFFKGMVSKVLPGIQTAFVDIGQEKAGFLHISEVDRELAIERLYKHAQVDDDEATPAPTKRIARQKIDIAKILREKEPILVQVAKEPVYEKGAKLTTCFTLPGRFLVLMPNIGRIGISKKIDDRQERARLRDMVKENIPEGMGAIIRTCAQGVSAKDLLKDLRYLVETWRTIEQKFKTAEQNERLYEDLDLVLQIVRDHLDEGVEAIIVDNAAVQSAIYKFVRSIAPEYSHAIKLYEKTESVFHAFDVERQIQEALDKKVVLESGGSLIIETTEAMTVIDVNTGKFIGKSNLEDTILKINLEAAKEITRQLGLRNIGGIIIIDFIDMASRANKQMLQDTFAKLLKTHDRFQSVLLKVSEFGTILMTRKRSGRSLLQQLMHQCPECHSLGYVKTTQTKVYDLLRALKTELVRFKNNQVTVWVHPEVFEFVTMIEHEAIINLQKQFGGKLMFASDSSLVVGYYKITI